MKKPGLVFFGTPEFAATILNGLITSPYHIAAVVTQPNQPSGRRQTPTPSPVKLLTQKAFQTPKTPQILIPTSIIQIIEVIKKLNPDLCILAAYAKIIPPQLLKIPKYGFLNIHPSLLPKYRGPSPIEYAILDGERKTGVTIIKMDEKLDHGPIISQVQIPISPTDTKASLTTKLGHLASQLLLSTLPHYLAHHQSSLYLLSYDRMKKGKEKIFLPPKPQDHKKASFTKILTRDNGFIEPKNLKKALQGKSAKKATQIERQIRAFSPWPGSWTKIKLKTRFPSRARKVAMLIASNSKLKTLRLKILKARLETQHATRNMQHEKSHPEVTSYTLQVTRLVLDQVQLEGKKPVSFEEFKKGYPKFKLS